MPAVQSDYGPMKATWCDPERRTEDREESWKKRSVYLEGKLQALSLFSVSLVRLIPSVSQVHSTEAEETGIDFINAGLDALPVEPPCAPSQKELAAHFADGWNDTLSALKSKLHS